MRNQPDAGEASRFVCEVGNAVGIESCGRTFTPIERERLQQEPIAAQTEPGRHHRQRAARQDLDKQPVA
jgi:hypothetical protein